jgi:hypothetical protein
VLEDVAHQVLVGGGGGGLHAGDYPVGARAARRGWCGPGFETPCAPGVAGHRLVRRPEARRCKRPDASQPREFRRPGDPGRWGRLRPSVRGAGQVASRAVPACVQPQGAGNRRRHGGTLARRLHAWWYREARSLDSVALDPHGNPRGSCDPSAALSDRSDFNPACRSAGSPRPPSTAAAPRPRRPA